MARAPVPGERALDRRFRRQRRCLALFALFALNARGRAGRAPGLPRPVNTAPDKRRTERMTTLRQLRDRAALYRGEA